MSQLKDWTTDGEEFEDILYLAMDNAKPGRQEEFCLDIEKSWLKYGIHMSMSEAQWNWLQQLANN